MTKDGPVMISLKELQEQLRRYEGETILNAANLGLVLVKAAYDAREAARARQVPESE